MKKSKYTDEQIAFAVERTERERSAPAQASSRKRTVA